MFSMPHFNAPKISAGSNFGGIHYLFNGNADDENGNYHGSPVNITYGGSGDEQYAIFNGTSSYIDTGYFLPSGSAGNDYSIFISLLRNPLDTSTQSRPFSTAGGGSEAKGFLCVVNDVRTLSLFHYTSGSSGSLYASGSINDDEGIFNNLVIVSRDGTIELYVNALLYESRTPDVYEVSNGTLALGLAFRFITNHVNNWNGYIREVQIVERALTLEEIENLEL